MSQNLSELYNYRAKPKLLNDRNILITGAGDGIGRAAALCFAEHGATTILLGRTQEKLESVYDEIEIAGGKQPAIMVCDMETANENSYTTLAGELSEQFGTLHGLLHNASILGEMKPLNQLSTETFEQVIKVNLTSQFMLTKALLTVMDSADDASLVFTSSGVGRKSRAYWGSYAVSKFATEGLMQTWADELGNTSAIRVNSLNPGATRTAMRRQAYPGENPNGNLTAQDIMPAYLFLFGPDSIGVNGQALNAQAAKQ